MKKIILLLIMLPFICNAQIEWGKISQKKRNFLKTTLEWAWWTETIYNVPQEVTLAICALESGWATDSLSLERNNLLGINIPGTKELMKFETVHSCFDYFGRLLSQSERYSLLKSLMGYINYCEGLYQCGYNPNRDYPAKLIGIIEYNQFNLLP